MSVVDMLGVGMKDEAVGTKVEVVADTNIFVELIKILSSFSHFFQNIEDNVLFKCEV